MSKIKKGKLGKIKWILLVIAVIAIIAFIATSSNKGTPVITSLVKKGDIKAYVEQRAKTVLPQIYKITMPYDSRILPVTKAPGDIVKKGEIVASLDKADITTTYEVAKANVENIQGQIKLNEYRQFTKTALNESMKWIKTMEQILDITKIKITASQHAFEYAIQHRDALVQSGRAVSRIEKNEAEMEAAVKEVDLQTSKMSYSAMDIFTEIWKLAPVYIKEYLKTEDISKELLMANLQKAKAELALAKIHLDMAEMKSPVDGTILKRYVTNERFLPIGTEILDIGIMEHLEIAADILTTEIANVKTGNSVDIFGTAIGSESIIGKVSKIEPQGFTDISSLGVKQQKVKIKITPTPKTLAHLVQEGKQLGVGYRLFVKIYTSEAKDVFVIPRTALFKGSNNQWEVFAVENNKAVLKKVKVGILNDESVEIMSGLNDKESVIIAPPTSLKDGTKVSIL